MRIIWLGLLLLSGSWLLLVPVFTPPHWAGFLLLAAGVILNTIALRGTSISQIDRKYLFAAAPLLISILVVPFPHSLGLIFLLSGLLVAIFGSFYRRVSWIGLGLLLTGLILAVQSLFYPLYSVLASRHYSLSGLSTIVCWLLKATGLSASWNQDMVFIQSSKEVLEFSITAEKLGAFFWMNILSGAVIILWLLVPQKRDRWLAFALLTSLIYLVLRCVGLILIYLDWRQVYLFWNPWITILSFAPLILFFLKFIPLKEDLNALRLAPLALTRGHSVLIGSSFLFAFLLVGAWGFKDPGAVKDGRILIDEKHSD